MSDGGDGDAKGSRDEPKARVLGCKALKRSRVSVALSSLTPPQPAENGPRRHAIFNYNPEYMLSITIHHLYFSLSRPTTPHHGFLKSA
jgi:hypothetical protein